jgi:glutamate 5-kinase
MAPNALTVIKFGSAILTNPQGGLDYGNLKEICDGLTAVKQSGKRVVVVTSGAVAAGRQALGIRLSQKLTIAEKQACAATGQARLMQAYADLLAPYDIKVAQILLSRGDMDDRRRYVNARYCLEELLARGVIPLINENDTTTVDELRFGDNDGLAAMVAVSLQASQLWILSDVEGLYDKNPKVFKDAKLLSVLTEIPGDLEGRLCAVSGAGGVGSGGMASKIKAARLATRGGVVTAIVHGRTRGQLQALLQGRCSGTWFSAEKNQVLGRRSWITAATPQGSITVDPGAVTALITHKRSLLPAGVREVHGAFDEGDIIEVHNLHGVPFAKGVTNYSAMELGLIRGRKTEDIESVLGTCPYHEVIHRDNLVVASEARTGGDA